MAGRNEDTKYNAALEKLQRQVKELQLEIKEVYKQVMSPPICHRREGPYPLALKKTSRAAARAKR
jgi:hypothetical protein